MEASAPRKPDPSAVAGEEWACVAPYLALMTPDAPQRKHDLRVLLRWLRGRADAPTATILDGRTLHRTPESGHRAGYGGYKRRTGSKVHAAVDTLGGLLALLVTPASASNRVQVGELTAAVQVATGDHVELAFVDQGSIGSRSRGRARDRADDREGARGQARFRAVAATLGRRARFRLASRLRRLARDFERLPETVAGLHVVAFACLMLHRLLTLAAQWP